MALHVPKAPGFAQMLKEGAKHYSGLEEAVFRNIQACKELAQTTRTAYGPNGMNKMVINHLEKLFVTNDAATIIRELEVQHPAAKMIVMASHMQEQEVGDGTNFVLVFAGALLELAEELLRMGLSVSEVIEGYEKACKKALEILPDLVCSSAKNLRDVDEVASLLQTAIMSKQYGNELFLSKLIAQACVSILPDSGNFNVDNIRVCKILGSGICSSSVLHGMVFKKEVEGDITSVKDAKIAVYSCPFDGTITETKGTVLINSAQELMNFSKGEENLMEEQVKAIADAGATVIVTGGKVADMALHYANKYNLMVVRLNSKWDLRRLCKTVCATALPRMTPPTAEEIGHCDSVYLSEVGDTQVVVFKHEKEDGAIATIVIRGSTDNLMDDVERAVDDAVNTFNKPSSLHQNLLPSEFMTERPLITTEQDLTALNHTEKADCGKEILLYGDTEKIVIGVVLSILTLFTIAGNALVIISVCIVKKLRQPSNYLVVSLAAADLSVAVAVMPFVIITDLVGGEWLFGKVFCNVFIAMDVMCCTASIMTLCVISVDRYLGITRPLTYPARQNGKLMAKMVFIVWLLSASITLPPLFGWAKNVNVERVCLISQDFGYTVYSTAVAFYIPMTVMLVMYQRIFVAAKISAEKHKFVNIPRLYEQEGIYCLEEKLPPKKISKRNKAVEEFATLSKLIRQDRKNISIFKREQKAARTLGIIVGAFTFCWLPFFLLSTARPFICGIMCSCMPLRLERTLLWLGYTNSLINPLIYAFFNRDLRTTFWNLLRCKYTNINRRLSAASMHEALKVTERHEGIL